MKATMSDLPVFKPHANLSDLFVHIRVHKINNGYIVRGNQTAFFCNNIEDTSETVKNALLRTDWSTKIKAQSKEA